MMNELRQHPFFSSLSEEHWSLLQDHLKIDSYAEGESIQSEETGTTDLHGVLTGRIDLIRETPFGTQVLATLKHNEFFGEMAFIERQALPINIISGTASTVWHCSGDGLWGLFAKVPDLAIHFYRWFWPAMAEKLNMANRRLKQFFAEGTPLTPLPAMGAHNIPPNRPAWFSPPQTPSPSKDFLSAQSVEVDTKTKRQAFDKMGLYEEEIDLLFERGEELAYGGEGLIFSEGDFGDKLYFILHGEVRISKQIPGAGEESLSVLGVGDIFGEMALVAPNAVRSASCYAHEKPALLLAFRHHVLKTIRGESEEFPFLQALCKMMAHRLRETYDKLVSWKMMRGGFF